jgi:hypothetical protein
MSDGTEKKTDGITGDKTGESVSNKSDNIAPGKANESIDD